MNGQLYLIPCPISAAPAAGQLPETTRLAALHCKVFLVENVKQARRFLKQLDPELDISTLRFYSMGKHAEENEMRLALGHLNNGEDLGMISDAGCPAVADPGWEAVHAAHDMGITIRPLIGPSSILLSLMASGMNGQQFHFHGYLPMDKKERSVYIRNMVSEVQRTGATQLFMDTPFRNEKLFQDIISQCPPTFKLCLAQDVTGPDESIITRSISDWKKGAVRFVKIPMMMVLGQG